MSQEAHRVLIADDHPLFRSGIRALLSAEPEMVLVGEATNGDEAISLAASLQPDLILMDLKMPGIGGIEATRRIVAANPQVKVLIVTMFEDDHMVFTSMKAGARGYLLKDAGPDEMLRAIRSVANGGAIFSAGIARRLLDFFAGLQPSTLPTPFPELTERELEILDLIAQGRSNHEIAQELFLSVKTISNNVSNIFSKLQVADRSQAMLKAREAGLGRI